MQQKPQLLLGSTGEAAWVFNHTLASFLQQDTAKALVHLSKPCFCWVASNSITSISILYYIIVRQTWKIIFLSFMLSPSPHCILPSLEMWLIWRSQLKTLKLILSGNCNSAYDLKYWSRKTNFLTSLKPVIMSWSKPAAHIIRWQVNTILKQNVCITYSSISIPKQRKPWIPK